MTTHRACTVVCGHFQLDRGLVKLTIFFGAWKTNYHSRWDVFIFFNLKRGLSLSVFLISVSSCFMWVTLRMVRRGMVRDGAL
jgi:hypothetical protein